MYKIIHLSDFHFKSDNENIERIEALHKDIDEQIDGDKYYVLFSGDLVHSGDDNLYDVLFEKLFHPLIKNGATEVFIVPGNHDISRGKTDKRKIDVLQADKKGEYLYDRQGKINLDNPFGSDMDPLENYFVLADILMDKAESNYYGYVHRAPDMSLVGLNSTWLSCDRGTDSDRGNLRIEPSILEKFANSISESPFKIAMFHHPVSWLEEQTDDKVLNILSQKFDLVLFGHVHSTSNITISNQRDEGAVFLQAPALRADWTNDSNGYSIISVCHKTKNIKVNYRTFSQKRQEFINGIEFCKDGEYFPRTTSAHYFKSLESTDKALLKRFVSREQSDYTEWYRSNILTKGVHSSETRNLSGLIMPSFNRKSSTEDGEILTPKRSMSALLIESSNNQFFIAPPDSGLTSCAFLAFKTLCESADRTDKIPVYFDTSQNKINRASLLQAAKKSALISFEMKEVESLAENGGLVFVVEGLSLGAVEQFNLFRSTIEKYFGNSRFIAFISSDSLTTEGSRSELQLSTDSDEIFELAEMEVEDIRKMVQNHTANNNRVKSEQLLAQILSIFKQMDEPIYPTSIFLVLDTLLADPKFNPINRARLLERYVEILLGRFELEDVREGAFTSTSKIELLSYIAKFFIENSIVSLSNSDWVKVCNDYSENFYIELPKNLLQEFMDKGLLTAQNGEITFRTDYLFSFFVAKEMKHSTDFAQSLMANDGFLKHQQETIVYSELEGTNSESVLDSVSNFISALEETLIKEYESQGVNLSEEWEESKKSSSEDLIRRYHDIINKEIEDAKLSDSEQDKIDNEELKEIERRRGILQREEVAELHARWLKSIHLYSQLIKNASQVPAQDKIRHIKKLFESGERWVGMMSALRFFINSSQLTVFDGVIFINQGGINPQSSAENFKFNAPNSMAKLLSGYLTNPQLGMTLRRIDNQLTSMQRLFNREVLLNMPDAENTKAFLTSLNSETDLVLTTCSLKTLKDRYLRNPRVSKHRTYIEEIITEVYKMPKFGNPSTLSTLKKRRLVQDARELAKKDR